MIFFWSTKKSAINESINFCNVLIKFFRKLKIDFSKENDIEKLKALIIEQAEIMKKQSEALKEKNQEEEKYTKA